MNEPSFESVDPRKLRRIEGLTILALIDAIILTSFTVASIAMMSTAGGDDNVNIEMIEGFAIPALIAGLVGTPTTNVCVLWLQYIYVGSYCGVRADDERQSSQHALENQTKGQFFLPQEIN